MKPCCKNLLEITLSFWSFASQLQLFQILCECNKQAFISCTKHAIKSHLHSNATAAHLRTNITSFFSVIALYLQFCSTASWSLDGFWWMCEVSSPRVHTGSNTGAELNPLTLDIKIVLSSFWTVYFTCFFYIKTHKMTLYTKWDLVWYYMLQCVQTFLSVY